MGSSPSVEAARVGVTCGSRTKEVVRTKRGSQWSSLRFWVGGKTEEAIKAGRARILTACGGYEDMNKLRITSAQKCMISLICAIGEKN